MDIVNQSLSSAHWVVLGSSVRGAHHIRDNQPRQDAFGIRLVAGNTVLIAVADGVGSAPQAEIGSHLAAATALDWLESTLWQSCPNNNEGWETIFRESFLKASNRLDEQAAIQNLPSADFATTLLLAAASPDYLITGQIGDGAIVAMEFDGVLFTASHPQQGEYANETFSITSPNSPQLTKINIHAIPVDCLALFSDGLQRLALHQQDNSPHQPFFTPLFQQLPGIEDTAKAAANLADFLSSDRVNALTGDDKTLVLAKRKTLEARTEG